MRPGSLIGVLVKSRQSDIVRRRWRPSKLINGLWFWARESWCCVPAIAYRNQPAGGCPVTHLAQVFRTLSAFGGTRKTSVYLRTWSRSKGRGHPVRSSGSLRWGKASPYLAMAPSTSSILFRLSNSHAFRPSAEKRHSDHRGYTATPSPACFSALAQDPERPARVESLGCRQHHVGTTG